MKGVSASQTGCSQAEPVVSALRASPPDALEMVPETFDPARAWRTDEPPFDLRPIYQFVLLEGWQEHSGQTWHRKFAGTASISKAPDNRWGYRREDIDRIQRDGDMIVVERIAGWVPAVWPRWDWFTPAQAMSTGTAKTAKPVEGEACQRGPKDAPIPSPHSE